MESQSLVKKVAAMRFKGLELMVRV